MERIHGDLEVIQTEFIQKSTHEQQANSTLASETLKNLNISIDGLPQRCQQLLKEFAAMQNKLSLQYDPISTLLDKSKTTSELLEHEYEILELKQENLKLKKRIEQNEKFLEELRRDLEHSRNSLNSQNLNPNNIDENLRQLKQKLTSYEEICGKAKAKFAKLQVPDTLLLSLNELTIQAENLKKQEQELKLRADDITLAREALHKLRRT